MPLVGLGDIDMSKEIVLSEDAQMGLHIGQRERKVD